MILAIANQKGGVGKTTTAINLASSLALHDQKTLLIDMDPQANSTLSFLDPSVVSHTIYDALIDPQINLLDCIVSSPIENLHLFPAKISLAKLEAKLLGDFDGYFKLKDRIAPLAEDYPFIIIDTPPTLGLITVSALVAATHLLIPIQSSYFALEGTDDLLETVKRVKSRPNPGLQILGILVDASRPPYYLKPRYHSANPPGIWRESVPNNHQQERSTRGKPCL